MDPTSNEKCTSKPCCCKGVSLLLLFVGFIVGFSVGFVTKDPILTAMTSKMIDAHQPPDEKIRPFTEEAGGTETVEPAGEEPAAQPTVTEPPVGEPSAAESPVAESPAAESPAAEPPVAEPPVAEPPVETQPAASESAEE